MKMVQTKMSQSESRLVFIIPLVGLSPSVPARCSGQTCREQREQRDNGFNRDIRPAQIWCPTIRHIVRHFLVTFSNVALNDAFNFVGNLVISSAVVMGPPVECCSPIRWTEGWLTRFQGHGCYDIQWHDNTAEWKARQYVVQALVNQTHLLWTSNWLTSLR